MTQVSGPSRTGWWRFLLAAVAALAVTVLGAGTASAATVTVAETRVGASMVATAHIVGPNKCITTGQRWGNAPSRSELTAGSCVAAKAVAPRFIANSAGDILDTTRVTIPEGRFLVGAVRSTFHASTRPGWCRDHQ